jgi:hypothetical protein
LATTCVVPWSFRSSQRWRGEQVDECGGGSIEIPASRGAEGWGANAWVDTLPPPPAALSRKGRGRRSKEDGSLDWLAGGVQHRFKGIMRGKTG